MPKSIYKVVMAIAALGALALGGAALADAASSGSSSGSASNQTAATPYGYGTPPAGPNGQQPPPNGQRPPGRHVGANGQQEKPLSSDTAAKVKEAALAKVSGGTIERVETDVDHGSPYEAHVRKSDGTELEVLVNKDFKVTAVNDMQHP
jgi:hypothetical protein